MHDFMRSGRNPEMLSEGVGEQEYVCRRGQQYCSLCLEAPSHGERDRGTAQRVTHQSIDRTHRLPDLA